MPGMQDEAEVGRLHRANECAPIHDLSKVLESLGKLDAVDVGGDRRERAEDFVRIETRRVRRIAFRVEGLRVSHPAAHPQDDHAIRRRGDLLQGFRGSRQTRSARGESGERGRRGGLEEIAPGAQFGLIPAERVLGDKMIQVHGRLVNQLKLG